MQSARHDLNSLAARILKDAQTDEAMLLAWPLACGSAVAARTRAVEFQDGTLYVSVQDRSWQAQLEDFSPHYKGKLAQLTGTKVERIRYQVQR